MSLPIGSRLGPYEIVGPLGSGGMGEVYRARDTRLGRDVAIKILPELLAADPDRISRFQREATALAALNHPHIAQIYGIEDVGPSRAIVMELVEGPTLAERGPLDVREALQVAVQIADALDCAHEKGIVHRDLKPANVKVRDDGTVKVLDFGLAKAMDPVGQNLSAASSVENSPTFTSPVMTQHGIVLGTAAYMAPEQARGQPVDKRADIWAFGVVLFEMLSGKRVFGGETVSDTLAALLRQDIPWRDLPAETPPSIRRVLARLLERDPKQRLRDIGDAKVEIADAIAGRDVVPVEPPAVVSAAPRARLPWIAAGLAAIAALALTPTFVMHQRERAPEVAPVHFSFPPPEGVTLGLGPSTSSHVSVSPDGRHIVFVGLHADGRTRLWLRPLDRDAPVTLQGTEGATYPFWSPTSSSIAFFAGGALKKTTLAGGPPQIVATTGGSASGGLWAEDDTILYSTLDGPMWRVQAAGGAPQKVAGFPDTGLANRFPSLLSGTRRIVSGYPQARVGTVDGQGDTQLPIQNIRSTPVYSAGHLLFGQDGVVRAQRFDPETLQVSGEVETVTGSLNLASPPGFAPFSASRDGVLAYVASSGLDLSRLEWAGRDGAARGVLAPDARYSDVSLSADGLRAAAGFGGAGSGATRQIWVLDVRARTPVRFTFEGSSQAPVWTQDGRRLYFAARRDGSWRVYRRALDGAGTEELVATGEPASHFVTDVSSDERFVAYNALGVGQDVHVLPLQPGGKRIAVTDSPANQSGGRFSKDGRAIAYTSDESGRDEVYVQPFPATGARRQVSVDGGSQPVWRADSRELFFLGPDGTMFAAAVAATPGIEHGTPVPLFKSRVQRAGFANPVHYAVTPDGQRFLMNVPLPQPPLRISVLTNWVATMKAAKPK